MATAAAAIVDRAETPEQIKAGIVRVCIDAMGHAADAMPELARLSRGGDHLGARARPYLNEVIHCLASALEGALIASYDAERAGLGAARRGGEDAVAIVLRDYLDRAA